MDLRHAVPVLPAVLAAAAIGLLAGCGRPVSLDDSSPNVKHITQGEFAAEVTHCPLPVAVEFYAVWAGPCREFAPVLDRVAGGYTAKIKFVKVNVEESPGLAQNYEVRTTPTVILFKDDKLADRIAGVPTEADLKTRLDSLVAGK